MIIGVIAGTLVDTQMGVDFLFKQNIKAIGYPVSQNAKEQNRLQLLDKETLYKEVLHIVRKAKIDNINAIFVYCNSLSATIDMDLISKEEGIIIVTPFVAYKHIERKLSSLLILAANGNTCGKIESFIEKMNKEIKLWSISALPLVEEIENNYSDIELYNMFNMESILKWAETIGIEGIVLGCTHFPYLKSLLENKTNIPIIDPAEIALEELMKKLQSNK